MKILNSVLYIILPVVTICSNNIISSNDINILENLKYTEYNKVVKEVFGWGVNNNIPYYSKMPKVNIVKNDVSTKYKGNEYNLSTSEYSQECHEKNMLSDPEILNNIMLYIDNNKNLSIDNNEENTDDISTLRTSGRISNTDDSSNVTDNEENNQNNNRKNGNSQEFHSIDDYEEQDTYTRGRLNKSYLSPTAVNNSDRNTIGFIRGRFDNSYSSPTTVNNSDRNTISFTRGRFDDLCTSNNNTNNANNTDGNTSNWDMGQLDNSFSSNDNDEENYPIYIDPYESCIINSEDIEIINDINGTNNLSNNSYNNSSDLSIIAEANENDENDNDHNNGIKNNGIINTESNINNNFKSSRIEKNTSEEKLTAETTPVREKLSDYENDALLLDNSYRKINSIKLKEENNISNIKYINNNYKTDNSNLKSTNGYISLYKQYKNRQAMNRTNNISNNSINIKRNNNKYHENSNILLTNNNKKIELTKINKLAEIKNKSINSLSITLMENNDAEKVNDFIENGLEELYTNNKHIKIKDKLIYNMHIRTFAPEVKADLATKFNIKLSTMDLLKLIDYLKSRNKLDKIKLQSN